MGHAERRNVRERSAKTRRLITSLIENPSVTLTIETLQVWLDVQMDAAQRILSRLVSSGLVHEVKRGMFVSGVIGTAPLRC